MSQNYYSGPWFESYLNGYVGHSRNGKFFTLRKFTAN